MATAHVNEKGIIFRKFNPVEQTLAWWESMLNELKAEHIPSLMPSGKRMTVDAGAQGGFRAIVYFTPSTVSVDEAIAILKKHNVDVYDVREESNDADAATGNDPTTRSFVHDSLAEIPESKLVERIVTDLLWGREFFQVQGMPLGMVSRQCVSLDSAPGSHKGDIDVLFCAPDLPDQAVAYQIKRIKLGINQLRNRTPSKLAEFKKLAQQTNLIEQMGFWQVYAHVIVVVDAREQNAEVHETGKFIFQGLSSELKSLLYSAVSSAIPLFDKRIGIGVMEFIQTMDSEPFTVGTHGLHIRRFCEPATQSEELTKWVADIFSKNAALLR